MSADGCGRGIGAMLEVAGRPRDQLYTLDPASPAAGQSCSSTLDSVSGALAGLALRHSLAKVSVGILSASSGG